MSSTRSLPDTAEAYRQLVEEFQSRNLFSMRTPPATPATLPSESSRRTSPREIAPGVTITAIPTPRDTVPVVTISDQARSSGIKESDKSKDFRKVKIKRDQWDDLESSDTESSDSSDSSEDFAMSKDLAMSK